jgi:hypothetical protein
MMLTLSVQVLGVTCDNASPNDVMINELPDLLQRFSGASSHTRCFNHVVALVAIRVVRQFDVPTGNSDEGTEAEQELRDLAEGLDVEDAVTHREHEVDDDEEDDEEIEEWADERCKLSAADREEHDESVRPVRMLLVKVSSDYFVITSKDSPANAASENLVCNNPLQHNLAAVVVCHA